MPIKIEELQILQQLKTSADNVRSQFEPTWKTIARSIDPSELRMLEPSKPGEASMQDFNKMYDTTGLESSVLFADGLQAYACGRSLDWFRIQPEDKNLVKTDKQKEYFQNCERHMMNQLNRSNFYDCCSAFFERGVNFATAIMLRLEDVRHERPMYVNLPLASCSLMANRYNEVDTLFRTFWLPVSEAVQEYGIDRLPSAETNEWQLSPNRLVQFNEYCGPVGRCKLSLEGDGAYCNVIWCESDTTHTVIEELLDSKPFFVWRYQNDPNGTPYGVKAPGWIYSPASRQLQSQLSDTIRISQMQGRPPIKATRGLEVNFTPNGITEVGPGEDFQPQPVTGDRSAMLDSINRFQTQIKSGYYVDFFLALMSHIEQTKTASEAYLLQDEKSAIMSTFFSKLASDFIEPLLEDLWASEIKYGRLPQAPPELQDINVRIDFKSPLASQQRRAHALSPTKQWLSEMLQIAQVAPSVTDVLNLDEYARMSGEYYEVDQRVMNSQKVVDQTRQAELQAQAQQQNMENQISQAQAGADVYAKTSKAPEKGSQAEQTVQQANKQGGR